MEIDWKQPGAACRDPETGERWRMGDDTHASSVAVWHSSAGRRDSVLWVCDGLERALADGPDLTDLATLGLLRLLLPVDRQPISCEGGWLWTDGQAEDMAESEADAIRQTWAAMLPS